MLKNVCGHSNSVDSGCYGNDLHNDVPIMWIMAEF